MSINDLTDALNGGLAEAGLAAVFGALIAPICRIGRRPRRIDSLDARVLRDIGYTRQGVREAALAARNEVRSR